MLRAKFGFLMALALLGMAAPAVSQAQSWLPDTTTYAAGGVTVHQQAGNSHYSIYVDTAAGGVNCYADPVSGGSCDVEVTLSFNWHWTGTPANITGFTAQPNGDLYGNMPYPLSGVYALSSVGTFGLAATNDSSTGPYGSAPVGHPHTFDPAPPSLQISATGQVHSIATLPNGPFSQGVRASSAIYWRQ